MTEVNLRQTATRAKLLRQSCQSRGVTRRQLRRTSQIYSEITLRLLLHQLLFRHPRPHHSIQRNHHRSDAAAAAHRLCDRNLCAHWCENAMPHGLLELQWLQR